MGALGWYFAGVATPIVLVLGAAVVGCLERLFGEDK